MKALLLVLVVAVVSTFTYLVLKSTKDLAVGQCYGSERKLFKILEVGQYSYKVVDQEGQIYTSPKGEKEVVDCFTSFDKFDKKEN